MNDIYAEKSYGSDSVGFGEKLAVLVVDFQAGFIDPKYRMGGSQRIEDAVNNTARLLEVARAKGVPVANCVVAYPNRDAMPYWKIDSVKRELLEGTDAVKLDPRIADDEYDYIFSKWGASAFFQTPVVAYLAKHRVDTVAVTGCVTSGCVRASIVDSFQFGFRTLMVDDCCGDHAEQPHQDTIRDVGRRYADVVTADEVIQHMMSNLTPSPS